jgi:hypothetical protein
MELDDIDIGILAFLSDVPNSTTTAISKALFKPPYNIRKLDSFIRYRMQRLASEKVVSVTKKKRKFHYNIDGSKVFFGEGILKMNGVGEIDMGYFVIIKKEDETIAKSLDDYERRIGKKDFS